MIRLGEPNPGRRAILFQSAPGRAFAIGDVQIQRAAGIREAARGHVEEVEPGHYRYVLHPVEVLERGAFVILVSEHDYGLGDWIRLGGQVVASLEHEIDPDHPDTWLDIAEPDSLAGEAARGDYLERLAVDRGVQRRAGETDAELRERLRHYLGNAARGRTAENLRGAVMNVVGVIDATTEERIGEIIVHTRAHRAFAVRGPIEDAVQRSAPAGISVRIALALCGAGCTCPGS